MNSYFTDLEMIPPLTTKQINTLVEKMLLMGYVSISEICERHTYSFTKEEFMKDEIAAQNFGWDQDLA